MYDLILKIAKEDSRIRAAYMNGSRTNKNVPQDIFRDYDVVYVVTETKSFIEDKEWIRGFGEIWFMQYPDEHPDFPSDKENFYGWLMQFRDGNRIDLHVETIEHAKVHIGDDKLCKILLDKDNVLPEIPEATDEDYHVKKPTAKQFLCCCNNFWWCLNNVAKGLWRKEIPYVQDMMNFVVRKQLEKVLAWKIGTMKDFSVSVGKSAKYMYRWLSKEEYEAYLSTYFMGTVEDGWRAVFAMTGLFRMIAPGVAEKLGYEYNFDEERSCMEFLEHVRNMPENADDFGQQFPVAGAVHIPESIQKIIHKNEYTTDTIGMSGSSVLLFDDKVLKMEADRYESENEFRVMRWLQDKLPVPEVICREKQDGKSYLLMSKVPDKMLCDEFYMSNPESVVDLSVKALKLLWQVDISDCPFDAGIDKKLQVAKYNLEHGNIDLDNVEPETFGEGGFENAQALLNWLIQNKPEEELVFTHGDFCLPNIFAKGDEISSFIDLGRAGVADRYQDIAICYRSLKHNFEGKYGGQKYENFNPDILFEKLGMEPDWEKIRYYILLDELF